MRELLVLFFHRAEITTPVWVVIAAGMRLTKGNGRDLIDINRTT